MAVKNSPPGGVESAKSFQMPRPPAIVVWRNAPNGDSAFAVVTKYNRNSVNLAIFPPDSRVMVPKEGVRFTDDPWNKTNGINADAGVWDFTDEKKQFHAMQTTLAEMALKAAITK